MIIYGLETCAICQKARKALETAGKDVNFRDIRAEPRLMTRPVIKDGDTFYLGWDIAAQEALL